MTFGKLNRTGYAKDSSLNLSGSLSFADRNNRITMTMDQENEDKERGEVERNGSIK